jgi:hypothetical protein
VDSVNWHFWLGFHLYPEARQRRFVFADEAGDFTFRRGPNISKYFILCTVAMDSCALGDSLYDLRRQLAWERKKLGDYFHATTDTQEVRDRVFALLQTQELRVDATVLEKSKAQPQTRRDEPTFYKYAWFYHFKHVAHQVAKVDDEVLLTAASIGTKKKRGAFVNAVVDVIDQTHSRYHCRYAFWPAQSDPCLQIADYCTWAIQRKWEMKDERSFLLIKDKIKTNYDLWAVGGHHYY